MSKFVLAAFFVVLCFQGLASAQKIDACGAEVSISFCDLGTSSTAIYYNSQECMELKEELEAERAFRKPNPDVRQRLIVLFGQGFSDLKDAYTLVVLKDGEVVARRASGVPTKQLKGHGYSTYLGGVVWGPEYNKPIDLPFECVLMTTSGSEHRLRFTVSPLSDAAAEVTVK